MAASDWYQQVLTPPEVVEIRIRLGFVPDTDHMQVLVEAFDPMSGVLLAQASMPHAPIVQFEEHLAWAVHRATGMVTEFVDPF